MDPKETDEALAEPLTNIADSKEYHELFQKAKKTYPGENDYCIHIACLSYFMDKDKDTDE